MKNTSWDLCVTVWVYCSMAVDDFARIRQLLRLVNGYAPSGEIVDWIYQQQQKLIAAFRPARCFAEG